MSAPIGSSGDVVIVGGGSAGSTLAARLSEDPSRSVLLLEAGPVGPLGDDNDRLANVSFALTARDWGLKARVEGERELDYPQGRFLGGGSSVNGALAFRGMPSDYDGWRSASWGWTDMLRCFRRLERDVDFGDETDVHGADGPIPIVRWREDELVPLQQAFRHGCESLGWKWNPDFNRAGTGGVGPFPMNRDGDVRVSTALAYVAPVLDRPNLTVRGDAQVARVLFTGTRATGVELVGGARIEAGEVVVSSGSFQSPALLMRSGIGPGGALVDNPEVGEHLTDHPGLFLFATPKGDLGPTDPQYQLALRYSSSNGSDEDMFLSMMNLFDLGGTPVVTLTCGVHEPRSRGRVTITSDDPLAPPRIDLNLLSHPLDVERLVEGLRSCRDVLHAGLGGFVSGTQMLSDDDFADDATLAGYVRSVVAGWYHPVGTCGIGRVVDDDLSVRGVDGLRVCDASVMPTICKAPTNLTTIAIAERAAELLR